MKKFEYFEHTADILFKAYGKDVNEVFKNAALAMFQVMVEEKINAKIKKKFKVEGKDYESLLYNFLEEFLFLLDAEDFLLSNISRIKMRDNKLEADITGDKASDYKFTNDVKAVTYNQMFVRKQGNKFIIQVVLDV